MFRPVSRGQVRPSPQCQNPKRCLQPCVHGRHPSIPVHSLEQRVVLVARPNPWNPGHQNSSRAKRFPSPSCFQASWTLPVPNAKLQNPPDKSCFSAEFSAAWTRVFDTSSKANKKSTSNTQPTRSQLQVPGPHLCSWARVGLANQSLQVFVAQVHHLFEDLPNLTLVTNNSNVVQLSFYHWISQTCMSIHICNPQITWLCNMTDAFLEAYSPKTWNLNGCFPKSNLLYPWVHFEVAC